MRLVSAVGLVGALLLASGDTSAQSLGEIAAREKERRKNQKPVKVYTGDELRRAGGTVSAPATPDASDPTPSAADPEAKEEGQTGKAAETEKVKTEEEVRAEREQAWRKKLEAARAEASRLSAEIEMLQTYLNDIAVQNLYTVPGLPNSRTTMLQRIDEAKEKLAAVKQEVVDLEEEGRRNRLR